MCVVRGHKNRIKAYCVKEATPLAGSYVGHAQLDASTTQGQLVVWDRTPRVRLMVGHGVGQCLPMDRVNCKKSGGGCPGVLSLTFTWRMWIVSGPRFGQGL